MKPLSDERGHWFPIRDGDRRLRALYNRHYSAHHYKDGRRPTKTAGPGEYMALMTVDCSAAWIWRKFLDDSGEQGVNNALFRNEGPVLSSLLIREASTLAWLKWPGERLYTYVDGEKVRHKRDPGRCFLRAGWRYTGHHRQDEACPQCQAKERPCGMTKSGKIVMERLPL